MIRGPPTIEINLPARVSRSTPTGVAPSIRESLDLISISGRSSFRIDLPIFANQRPNHQRRPPRGGKLFREIDKRGISPRKDEKIGERDRPLSFRFDEPG
jgi:hypothetical protein